MLPVDYFSEDGPLEDEVGILRAAHAQLLREHGLTAAETGGALMRGLNRVDDLLHGERLEAGERALLFVRVIVADLHALAIEHTDRTEPRRVACIHHVEEVHNLR